MCVRCERYVEQREEKFYFIYAHLFRRRWSWRWWQQQQQWRRRFCWHFTASACVQFAYPSVGIYSITMIHRKIYVHQMERRWRWDVAMKTKALKLEYKWRNVWQKNRWQNIDALAPDLQSKSHATEEFRTWIILMLNPITAIIQRVVGCIIQSIHTSLMINAYIRLTVFLFHFDCPWTQPDILLLLLIILLFNAQLIMTKLIWCSLQFSFRK